MREFVVYQIVCNYPAIKGYSYVGSSFQFERRIKDHKKTTPEKSNMKLYRYTKMLGWDFFEVKVLERRIGEKEDKLICEEKWRQELKPCLNSRKCFSTPEELKELNRSNAARYYKANRDSINEKKRQNWADNREEFRKERREHYAKNKEAIIQKARKQQAEAKAQKLYYCHVCDYNGATKSKLTRHLKTLKHKKNVVAH